MFTSKKTKVEKSIFPHQKYAYVVISLPVCGCNRKKVKKLKAECSLLQLPVKPRGRFEVPYLSTDLPSQGPPVGPGCLSSLMMQNPGFHSQRAPAPDQVIGLLSPPCKERVFFYKL